MIREELFMYKIWKKLCKKIINKNLDSEKIETMENEILEKICDRQDIIKNLKFLSLKVKMRKITRKNSCL
jgi:hypothetical protein